MQTKTYSDVFASVKALAGVSDFTDTEQAMLLSLANRRLYEAYSQSQVWPRYLVVGEPRAVENGSVIPFSETGKPAIADYIRIHRTQPFLSLSAAECEYYVDSAGAHILNPSEASAAFVTYKKQWDGPYTAASTDVPLEFFYFCIHATYADYLRMDGQTDRAMAEETVASNYLALELQKTDYQRNNTVVTRRISTVVNRSR